MSEAFRKFANIASRLTGSAGAFLLAFLVVLTWALTGPLFGFSDTWQLVINTGTTVVTFLMVFLIQNTQNRDSQALHAKLDELVIHNKEADNHLVEAEDLPEEELDKLKQHYTKLAATLGEGVAGSHRKTGARKSPQRAAPQRRKPATPSRRS